MSAPTSTLEFALLIAGFGQLALAAGSVFIPRVLDWRRKLADLDPLLRRLFWVYAAYILGTNIALGVVSGWLFEPLAAGGSLALAVNLYAAIYWISRLVIQFAFFHDLKPEGKWFRAAEFALIALFLFLSATYLTATVSAFGATV